MPHTVGDQPRQDKLFTDSRNLGLPSLSEENVLDVASALDVTVVTLDDHLRQEGLEGRVTTMKVDVQGAEAQVIAGAKKLFEQPRLSALVEFGRQGSSASAGM